MSKTADKTKNIEKGIEDDELENAFLNDCNIEDLPLPNPKLEDYQNELREVMKSGCNLQIAEYSLIELNIFSLLGNEKKNYNEQKNKIMNNMEDEIDIYFNDVKSPKYERTEIIEEDKDREKFYEEEADEIMEKRYNDIDEINDSNNKNINLNLVKEDLMNMFKKNVNNSINENEFKEAKRKYIEKREAIIEAALRIVKKIVNDEGEYKKFKENYLDKLKEQK